MSNTAITLYRCYKDPVAAANWLQAAFGLPLGKPIRDVDGRVIYISLVAGGSRVLVGPASGTRFEGLIDDPVQTGEKATHICYQMVENVDAHRRTAEAAGAQIELGPVKNGDGQVYYLCRDIEGHLWSFGAQSFDEPSSHISEPVNPLSNQTTMRVRQSIKSVRKPHILALAVIAGILVSGVWLASWNSDLAATENEIDNSSGAERPVRSARGTDQTAEAQSHARSTLVPKEGPTLVGRDGRIAASHRKLENDLFKIEAELQEAKKQGKAAEKLLIEERDKFKIAIGKGQDKLVDLRIGLQRAAMKSEQTIKQLADAKNEISALKRDHRAEGHKFVAAAKGLQEAGRRFDTLASEFESLKRELSASRRAEAQVLTALTAWKEAADGANQRSTAIETRQQELSRAVETLVQKLQEENGRDRDARRVLATISRHVHDVRDQAAELNGTMSSLRTAVQASAAKIEEHVVSLQTKKAAATGIVRVSDHADRGESIGETSPAYSDLVKSKRSTLNKTTSDKGLLANYTELVTDFSTPESSELEGATRVDNKKTKRQGNAAKRRKETKKAKKRKKRSRHARLSLKSRCARNAWSRLYKSRRRSFSGIQRTIKRLCAGARGSVEPVRCMRQILAGRVDWGGGKRWPAQHALRLCAGTRKASARIGCFRGKIKTNQGWRSAISQCSES